MANMEMEDSTNDHNSMCRKRNSLSYFHNSCCNSTMGSNLCEFPYIQWLEFVLCLHTILFSKNGVLWIYHWIYSLQVFLGYLSFIQQQWQHVNDSTYILIWETWIAYISVEANKMLQIFKCWLPVWIQILLKKIHTFFTYFSDISSYWNTFCYHFVRYYDTKNWWRLQLALFVLIWNYQAKTPFER